MTCRITERLEASERICLNTWLGENGFLPEFDLYAIDDYRWAMVLYYVVIQAPDTRDIFPNGKHNLILKVEKMLSELVQKQQTESEKGRSWRERKKAKANAPR